MQREGWTLRVSDILDAIAKIQRYTIDISFDEFSAGDKTVDAVFRNLEVIGEAARHIPDIVRNQHIDVPWGSMTSMRNFVIHEYADVSLTTVWETIQQDLPPLVPRLHVILAQSNQDE